MKPENRCDVVDQMEYKSSYGNNRVRVIRLRRNGSIPLGFSVRGGKEHGTGIFVSEVQIGSEAHHQGLQIGDQILRVNGFNIEHAIHEEVLNLLRAKPGVVLKVKSVGMIPVKNSKKDPLTWKIVDPSQSCSSTMNGSQSSSCASSLDEQNDTKITINAVGASGLGCRIPPAVNIFSNENNYNGHHCVTDVSSVYTDNGHSTFNGNGKECTTQLIKVSATVHAVNDGNVRECGDGMENSEEDVCSSQQKWNSEKQKSQDTKIVKEQKQNEEETDSTENIRHTIEKNHINGQRNDFLAELQRCGERRNMARDEASDQSSLSSEDSRRTQKSFMSTEKSRYEEDMCKRKQHEMLMEEFREAHKKMFSTECIQKSIQERNNRQKKEAERSLYYHRQQVRDRKTSPLPPPPLEISSMSQNLITDNDKDNNPEYSQHVNKGVEEAEKETGDSTASEVGDISMTSRQQGSSHVLPHSPDPHVFVDPSCHEVKSNLGFKLSSIHNEETLPLTSKQARRQCLPITDSRGLEPKPPQIYFEKTPGNSKPLVTIGTYPNSTQQNRFLYPPGNAKSKQNNLESKEYLTIADENSSDKTNSNFTAVAHSLNHSSSSSSVTSTASDSSSSSSKPKSPSSFKPKSPSSYSSSHFPAVSETRTLKLAAASPPPQNHSFFTVPNVVIKESSKNNPLNNVEEKSDNGRRIGLVTKKCVENNICKSAMLKSATNAFPLNKEFNEEQLEGREVKTLFLDKKGPLNMRVEGGNNCSSDGRILVSEIWEGGCVRQDGSVEPGDQILMVDNTPLIGVSLTAANAALRNAMCNAEKQLRLVIAKARSPS